ncbi:MAG: hypothetical protein ABJA35_11785 [Parafilimonas sp.]
MKHLCIFLALSLLFSCKKSGSTTQNSSGELTFSANGTKYDLKGSTIYNDNSQEGAEFKRYSSSGPYSLEAGNGIPTGSNVTIVFDLNITTLTTGSYTNLNTEFHNGDLTYINNTGGNVIISNINNGSASGTFSGSYILIPSNPVQTLTINDGMFTNIKIIN